MAVLIDITYQTQAEVVLSSETDLEETKYPFHLYHVNDMNFFNLKYFIFAAICIPSSVSDSMYNKTASQCNIQPDRRYL